jgi:iron(III) transport system substrate-binding protein
MRPLLLALFALGLSACSAEPDLVVYCALDEGFSEPLLRRFEKETGLDVEVQFDTEASKTVGLVRALIEEAKNPRCDVFWNNEIAQTVRLAEAGMLEPYDSPSAADIPEQFRDPERRWTGFAARARIFIVNTDLVDPSELKGMADLLDPKWKTRVGMARPLTGTTLTHATALFDALGEEDAIAHLTAIRDGGASGDINIGTSNGQVMRLVREGTLAWGWTDTDDYNVAREEGFPVAAVYPDQGEGELGTLVIPNTICIPKGAPHQANAQRLVDWVLREEIERELAHSRSAQIPVRDSVERPEHVRLLGEIRAMQVSFVSLGKQMERRSQELAELFLQ